MLLAQLESDWGEGTQHLQLEGGPTSQKGCVIHQVQLLNRLPGLVCASGETWPTGVRHRLSQASVLLGLPQTVHTTLGVVCVALDGVG